MSDARELLERSDVYGPEDEGDKRLMRDALLAVLDLHKPCEDDLDPGEQRWCLQCDEGWDGWNFDVVRWPCPTVRAIDKALGVSDE